MNNNNDNNNNNYNNNDIGIALGPVLQRVAIDSNQSQVLQSIESLQSPISYS